MASITYPMEELANITFIYDLADRNLSCLYAKRYADKRTTKYSQEYSNVFELREA